jgi:hypothetical protein
MRPLEPNEAGEEAGTFESVLVGLLLGAIPAALVYIVLDLPWYLDAVVWVACVAVLLPLIGMAVRLVQEVTGWTRSS